jgi:hypothetical protein
MQQPSGGPIYDAPDAAAILHQADRQDEGQGARQHYMLLKPSLCLASPILLA